MQWIRFSVLLALAVAIITLRTAPVAAQYVLEPDADLRVGLDSTFYTGTPGSGPRVTVLAPVLYADLLFGVLRLGAELPMAGAWATRNSATRGLFDAHDASRLVLGNPTVHAQLVVDYGDYMQGRVGLGFAFAVRDRSFDMSNIDDAAEAAALTYGAATRGVWNIWWYERNTHSIFVPADLRYRMGDYETGVEGALIFAIPSTDPSDTRDVSTALQAGLYAALTSTSGMAALGLRWRNFVAFTDELIGGDRFQSSVELFAQGRIAIVLLELGVLANLDEPFGVFGDGQDIWALRGDVGLAF